MQAVRRDTDATASDGALAAVNTRFYFLDEVRRRNGMTLASATPMISGRAAYYPSIGDRVITATSSGTIEAYTP